MFLYYTDPMLRGPAVRRLQELLLELGYDVGPYGADGAFGEDTLRAVMAWQGSSPGLTSPRRPTGVVDDKVWDALEQQVSASCPPRNSFDIIDTTRDHDHPRLYRAARSPRPWAQITGVTLHQTACILADRPGRWGTLNAHVGVFQDGAIIVVNKLTDFIWHAQGLSHTTIGVEFNGNFPGVAFDRRTWWPPGGPMCELTPGQLAAIPRLFEYLKAEFEAHGSTWKHVHAHRQASKDRRADPGQEIWREVAIPWIEALGASDGGPDYTYGTGRPIPHEWNPAYPSRY